MAHVRAIAFHYKGYMGSVELVNGQPTQVTWRTVTAPIEALCPEFRQVVDGAIRNQSLARLRGRLAALVFPPLRLVDPEMGPSTLSEARAVGRREGIHEALRLVDELQHGYERPFKPVPDQVEVDQVREHQQALQSMADQVDALFGGGNG